MSEHRSEYLEKLQRAGETTFLLPRPNDSCVGIGMLVIAALLIGGTVVIASGEAAGWICVGIAALIIPFLCHSVGDTVLVFDNRVQQIHLERKQCNGGSSSVTLLGSFDTFQRAEIKEYGLAKNGNARYEIRFVFTDGTKVTDEREGPVEHARSVVKQINLWWTQKKKKKENIQAIPQNQSSSPIAPSAPLIQDELVPTGNSEGNIVGNDVNVYAESMRSWMVSTVKLPEYTELLIENGFDRMEMFDNLSMEDLNLMGITKIGHRKRILAEAQKLNGSLAPSQPSQEVDKVDDAVIIDIPMREASGDMLNDDANVLQDQPPGPGASEPPPAFQEGL